MSSRKSPPKRNKSKPGGIETFLKGLAKTLGETDVLKEGTILLRLTGTGGGEFYLECSKRTVRLSRDVPKTTPLIEVKGDARRVRAIIEGTKDAVVQFGASGVQVRGDLKYLSDLLLELGIIEEPF